MLRIDVGSIVSIDNENGKCNIRPSNPAPIQWLPEAIDGE